MRCKKITTGRYKAAIISEKTHNYDIKLQLQVIEQDYLFLYFTLGQKV